MSIKITEEGKTLLEDAILQDKKVVFSQIELISDVEKSPTEMVKRVDVSKVSASDYNTITVQAQIDNDGFLDTYYFNRANVYADEVLFAYDDGINICIPAETTKVINDLEMMMKIDSAVADLKIIYEGYVLRKDFDDMESKIQKINTTIKDMEANAVTQNDCTDQVSWNSQIVKKEFLTIGNMAFFRATGGFSTSRGSIVLATIPQGYFPETTRNQSSYELMGVFTSAYDKERRNCYVTLNCLSGNVDLQINNNEAYSDTRSDDNVQMIFYGFWKMNTESQGGTGGSISYREDIEKLRQSIQDSKKEIVKSGREIDSLKEDLTNVDFRLSDVFDKGYNDSVAVNMINPSNFIVGTLNTQGEAKENSSSSYSVTDYIPVENGKTYALTYYNVNYQTRYPLVPNRLAFYNSNKDFVNQSTNYADNDMFATVRVNISGNTGYTKLTAKQSGYVRMQFGISIEKPMMAKGDVIEWTDVYSEQQSFVYTLKNGIIDEDNLADELKEKIESSSIGALDAVYKFAFCKVHKKTLHIGDSLTEGYHASNDIRKSMSYPSHMASLAGYDVTNKGHSGITAYDWWNTYKSIDFTGYDAVFIYLGTNGGLTDTIDADTASGDYNTFASTNTGGYCAIVSKIRNVNPKAKIYIIQYNQTTVTSQVTAKIAQKYGCTTLMVTDTSVFTLTDSKFHTDATHYNTIGYWAFACVMLAQLEKYIAEHISEYTDLVGTGEIIKP